MYSNVFLIVIFSYFVDLLCPVFLCRFDMIKYIIPELRSEKLHNQKTLEISTKETEEQLSDFTGQDIKLVEEPDWRILAADRDKLETWAYAVCMSYETQDNEKIDACVDTIEKIVKQEESVDSGSQKIWKLMREDPEEVAKTLLSHYSS
ncbi:MAG: hypothetical protein ABSB40_07215 [Nitrososphaeria archaeon]|jgi:hypothetical protein